MGESHLRLPLRHAAEDPPRARGWLRRPEWITAALAVAIALAPLPLPARIACVVVVLVLLGASLRARRPRPPAGWIVADAAGLARERTGAAVALARWGARFGVTVLANDGRDRGLLAFTTPEQTRYVPVRATDDDDAMAARDLFAKASTLPEAELAGAAIASASGANEALSASDALQLLAAVQARDVDAVDRILLSDPRGAPIVLDGSELRAGDRVIDLASPLEWRPFLFLESAGSMASVVQATWVRQAGVEVVLVAPMPGDATARDAASKRPASDAPPPHELRMAIERLFMAPLRQALDRAPRASRVPAAPPVRAREDADRRA